ncbi:tyrosine-type recombinase/integrase [Pseudomonas petrae]|uniref:tyrosine-type recombinase/integrase n=1 Tax=Pseudomonas petrae TaxID=2912190 RepID=UPI001F01BE54|nr:tyrosine-type recombinase/integrase [Pseudomonas petrae]MCF7540228.1 tyrosine-type recombinase/integrase [Pseudomonas petrae]
MINPPSSVFVTSPVTSFEPQISPATRLSRPYHYRRNGIYYVRLRVTGSVSRTVSVSLHTTDRRIAIDASNDLAEAVRVFHLGCPQATWHQLRDSLVQSAASLLKTSFHTDTQRLWGGLYGDVGTRNSLVKNHSAPSHQPEMQAPLTFEVLSKLYLADRAGEQKPTTLSSTQFTHGVIGSILQELDLRTHTREDLVALRDQLVMTRKPSTVNQMLMKVSAVLNWAVNNGHLIKAFDKKLKFTKGIESTRKAFSQDQIGMLMDHASRLPEASWKRWLLSLGVITGGRLNEISQLCVTDIQTLESGVVVIHINELGEGKSIKNKRSERQVPLTDGAYGFDLQAFMRYVETCKQSGNESLAQIGYRPAGEWANQQAIPQALGECYVKGLVFHSLRHSLASLMQAKGVPTAHAQAVMGHASGTITFDTYGSGVPVEIIAELLRVIFSAAPSSLHHPSHLS